MRSKPNRGSHLPVLMKLLPLTTGTILEFGCGMYSTPYLHWACHTTKRKLITYEDHADWREFIEQFRNDYHQVEFVTDWNSIKFPEASIAFVDHDPVDKHFRAEEIKKLTHVDYVVCHDAENKSDHKYGYSSIHKLFKYRFKYTGAGFPYTLILSNKYELKGI